MPIAVRLTVLSSLFISSCVFGVYISALNVADSHLCGVKSIIFHSPVNPYFSSACFLAARDEDKGLSRPLRIDGTIIPRKIY